MAGAGNVLGEAYAALTRGEADAAVEWFEAHVLESDPEPPLRVWRAPTTSAPTTGGHRGP